MNRLIHLLFPVALGLASGAAADLVASLDAGGNKWGYAAPHAATVQPWDGSPFTLEAELLRPAPRPLRTSAARIVVRAFHRGRPKRFPLQLRPFQSGAGRQSGAGSARRRLL